MQVMHIHRDQKRPSDRLELKLQVVATHFTQVPRTKLKSSYPGTISPALMQYFQHIDAQTATDHMKSDVEFSIHSIMLMSRKIQTMEHFNLWFSYQGCLAYSNIVILLPAKVKSWASEYPPNRDNPKIIQILRSYFMGSRMQERGLHSVFTFQLRVLIK